MELGSGGLSQMGASVLRGLAQGSAAGACRMVGGGLLRWMTQKRLLPPAQEVLGRAPGCRSQDLVVNQRGCGDQGLRRVAEVLE